MLSPRLSCTGLLWQFHRSQKPGHFHLLALHPLCTLLWAMMVERVPAVLLVTGKEEASIFDWSLKGHLKGDFWRRLNAVITHFSMVRTWPHLAISEPSECSCLFWGTRSAVRTDPSGLGRAALVAVYVSQMPGALGSGGARAPISRGSSGWHST